MTNEKSLDLFGYSVKLARLPDEEGGGWLAEVPELEGCTSDGETPYEALRNIHDAIMAYLESMREHGKPVPSPMVYEEPGYSGKFTLRIPRSLHRFLANQADREGVSLNQYILSLISFNAGKRSAGNPQGPRRFDNDSHRAITYTILRMSASLWEESHNRRVPWYLYGEGKTVTDPHPRGYQMGVGRFD